MAQVETSKKFSRQVTGGQITEVKNYTPIAFYRKIFSNDANRLI
jgi:hypothetical protein